MWINDTLGFFVLKLNMVGALATGADLYFFI